MSGDPASRPHTVVEQRYGRRTCLSLQDILDFANDAALLVSRGREAYDSDRMLALAAEAIVNRIGEASGRVSPELVADHPEIPFRRAKGIRNFVSHRYDRVDPAVVWAALETDIPPFAAQVRGLLQG